jgi:hypothetical protein
MARTAPVSTAACIAALGHDQGFSTARFHHVDVLVTVGLDLAKSVFRFTMWTPTEEFVFCANYGTHPSHPSLPACHPA